MADGARYDPRYWIFNPVKTGDLSWANAEGFGGVGFWGADRQGDQLNHYFASPTLAARDWAIFEGDRGHPARAHHP
jgi:hypothetical protein